MQDYKHQLWWMGWASVVWVLTDHSSLPLNPNSSLTRGLKRREMAEMWCRDFPYAHIFIWAQLWRKMATGYVRGHHPTRSVFHIYTWHDAEDINQPSPRKLSGLIKAQMGVWATEAPGTKGHSSATWVCFFITLCWRQQSPLPGEEVQQGHPAHEVRDKQHQPPETSMEVSLLCFLFKTFIQIDIKIDSRITSSFVLSYGPLPESPP